MMADFYIGQNDTAPSIRAILSDTNGPIDLSGFTVEFRMVDGAGILAIAAPAVIEDATGGVVRYDWQEGDTVHWATFYAELRVTLPNGRVMSVPNGGKPIEIAVKRQL